MGVKASRYLIPIATNLATDPDVYPILAGQNFINNKKPMWSTGITESVSGREKRRAQWSYPRWEFELSYDLLRNNPTDNELNTLLAFFNSKKGQYQDFLFYDPEDHTIATQTGSVGNGVATIFTLKRTVTANGKSYSEPVYAYYGTPTITVNGVATTSFTVGDYGQIIFSSPPGNGHVITFAGQFFYVCRFTEDELSAEQMVSLMWTNDGITFKSIKP